MFRSDLLRAAVLSIIPAGIVVGSASAPSAQGACVPGRVTPASTVRFGAGAQTFAFLVDGTGSGFTCNWAPSTIDVAWITKDGEFSHPGAPPGFFGSSQVLIAANASGAARTGHIVLANGMGTITVIQEAAACVVAPASVSVGRAGGTITIPIQTTTLDCAWAAEWTGGATGFFRPTKPDSYHFSTGAIQSMGPDTLEVSVGSNEEGSGPRSGTLKVGGVDITINQEAPLCAFTLSPEFSSVAAGGATGSVTLGGAGSNCSYTATAEGGLTITGGASGTAPATITYSIPANASNGQSTYRIVVGSKAANFTQAAPALRTDVRTGSTSQGVAAGVSFAHYRPDSGAAFTSPAFAARLTNATTPTGGWSASADQPWVTVTPASGNTPSVLTIAIDAAQAALLPIGSATAVVSVASADASQGTLRIPVALFVENSATSADPAGAFDTPNVASGTTVSGAVPVTGWAHDVVGIQRIVISRAAVAGEPSGAEIYIGDAVRVRGARGDVAYLPARTVAGARYPYPESQDGGWGYMLLTNALPAGNGTFTLYADAIDREGRSRRLNARTFTVDNATSIRPFGTIDEPAQGATVSGTIVNRGWVLTPSGKSIPIDGSTIKVYIDGVLLGPVTSYNLPRPDVKAYFPGLANSDGPEARLSIDTTSLADGVHTIAWGVVDSNGVAEGIGSRYFTVQNGTGSVVAAPDTSRAAASIARLPPLRTDVWSRAGVDETGWAVRVEPQSDGSRRVIAPQGQRLEIFLDPTLQAACGTYEGHLVSGDVAAPLPMGASLDRQHGIFRWQPGAEVAGDFAFVFVQRGCDGTERRIPLRVTVRQGTHR